ncbi:MAG: hypothetical protein ABSB35_35820 [Bryobacteraceae bacterium]|jgi:hypothetical protein
MDANARLDQATLGTTLEIACYTIADAFIDGGNVLDPGVSVLTTEVVEDGIPGHVFNLAVSAGWLPKPTEPPQDGVELGEYTVAKEYRDEFLNLIEPTLSDLRDIAEFNDLESMPTVADVEIPSPGEGITEARPRRLPSDYIDEYMRLARQDGEAFSHAGIARQASKIGESLPEGERAAVTAVSISRMYNGHNLGHRIRYCVATLFNRKFPCHMNNLLWPEGTGVSAKKSVKRNGTK